MGILRDSGDFSGHAPIYRAHRAVIFAIAQLSCGYCYSVYSLGYRMWNLNLCVQVGFAKNGKISALDLQLYTNCGHTVDGCYNVSGRVL